jgi:hypothetical protein
LANLALESAKENEKEQQRQQPTKGKNAASTTPADSKEKRHRRRNNINAPSALRRHRAMMEIRRLIADGHTNDEIAAMLNLPVRSFYRYRSQAFADDAKTLKEQNKDALAFELSILRDRLCECYRSLSYIAGCKRYRTKDRCKPRAQLLK